MQSKKSSLIEALANTGFGFCISVVIAIPINYVCGIEASIFQISGQTALFTVVSVVRNYVTRRWFNKREKNEIVT
jgi:membrane protein implicated in regulation of membrane protease activity